MSTSTLDLHAQPSRERMAHENHNDNGYDEEERGRRSTREDRREARRLLGRESYARRKEASAVMGGRGEGDDLRDRAKDYEAEEEEEEEVRGREELPPPPARNKKKRKSEAYDAAYHPPPSDSDTSDDEEAQRRPRRKPSDRRLEATMATNGDADFPTPPKKTRLDSYDSKASASTTVSKFKEGSMRDRASAVPPREIVGMLDYSPPRHEDVYYERAPVRQSSENSVTSNASSGVGGLFSSISSVALAFNPFKIAKDIREAWDRQKADYIAYERRKRMLKERKKKGQLAYEELKRRGAAAGFSGNAAAVAGAKAITRIRHDVAMSGIDNGQDTHVGMAASTDNSRRNSWANGEVDVAGRKRRRSELTASVGSTTEMRKDLESYIADYSRDGTEVEGDLLGNLNVRSDSILSDSSIQQSGKSLKSARSTSKLTDVKTLVKKGSKVFASPFRQDDSGMSKREIRRQERLKHKVSNLEEQLEKARRELESAVEHTTIPPVPKVPRSASSSTHPRDAGLEEEMLPREFQPASSPPAKRDKTPEGLGESDEDEDTEVEEGFNMIPLSPVLNSSFGGSFNATAMAGMSIMESLDENDTGSPNTTPPVAIRHRRSNLVPLEAVGGRGEGRVTKRSSTPNLGMIIPRRKNTTGGSLWGAGRAGRKASEGAVGGARHSPPPPEDNGNVPPVPRINKTNST
jgi:hypothetical protein